MLKLADLASRADFDAGPLRISPARRSVEGPAGTVTVEPIVMKVFLLLLDARGAVVTRDELFGNAWGGVFVGDDSLNRAIARVRKIAAETAPGLFAIETIPRTGYRLTGNILAADQKHAPPGHPDGPSRRLVVGSAGVVALAALAGYGFWTSRSRQHQQFSELVDRGEQGLEYGDDASQPADDLRRAVALRPGDASAQGLLAFALMSHVNNVNAGARAVDVESAERAADSALRIDPNEPNAQLARIDLEQSTLDMATTEDRLRAVLTSSPNNIFAMRSYWSLLQCAGISHAALALVERAIAIKPLAASNNYPLAQLLWIVGRTAEADRIIDRAMQFWPSHRYVRFARFTIFAFTGRPRAALAMLDSDGRRPQSFPPASVALWRKNLAALDEPSPTKVAAMTQANIDAVKANPALTSQAVLALSALGQVDAALDIANDLLVFRNPAGHTAATSTAWRFTPWIFTPPAGAMRADPRFSALCDGIGLTAYWNKRGIQPDYRRYRNITSTPIPASRGSPAVPKVRENR